MTDSMKFGPEWLRNMSNDSLNNSSNTFNVNNQNNYVNGNSSNVNTAGSQNLAPRQLAEFRYGREEMLSLYDKNMRIPEILPSFKKLFVDKLQCPLALTPSTEDDISPVSSQQRPWSLRSPVSFGGTNSIRGITRGALSDRGGRGKPRGFLHSNTGYQRPTNILCEDELRHSGSGSISSTNKITSSAEKCWQERNGIGITESVESNDSPSSSPQKNFIHGNSTASMSNPAPGIGSSTNSRPLSNHMENWRRTRMDEENLGNSDYWRGQISSNSNIIGGGNFYRWSRSTSWREDDNNTGSSNHIQRSFSVTTSNSSEQRGNVANQINSFPSTQQHSLLESKGKNNLQAAININSENSAQWHINSDQDDLLPEWATEKPTDSGGCFDASGAFHNSNEENDENLRNLQNTKTDISFKNIELFMLKNQKDNDQDKNEKQDDTNKSNNDISDNDETIKQSKIKDKFLKEDVDCIEDSSTQLFSAKPQNINIIADIDIIDKETNKNEIVNRKQSDFSKLESTDQSLESVNIISNNEKKINKEFDIIKKKNLPCNESLKQNITNQDVQYANEISDRMQEVDEMVAKLITDDEILSTNRKHEMDSTQNVVNSVLHQEGQRVQQSETNNVIVNSLISQPHILTNSQTLSQSGNTATLSSNNEWFYRDPQGKVQGPFTALEMTEWYRAGYFDENLFVARTCDSRYAALGELVKLCGNNIPFLSSHLIPALTEININTSSHCQNQLQNPQNIQQPSNQQNIDCVIGPNVIQQQNVLHHNPNNIIVSKSQIIDSNNVPGQITSSNNVNNSSVAPDQILLMQQLYYLQKQFYLKHKTAILSQLTQSEPWNMLSREQQQVLLNQQMSQIAYPEYLNSLQALSQSLNVVSPISYNLHQLLAAGKHEINQTKVNPNWFNNDNGNNSPISKLENNDTNETSSSNFNFHNLMHQNQTMPIIGNSTLSPQFSLSNHMNQANNNNSIQGSAEQSDPIKSLLMQLQMQKAVAAAASNVSSTHGSNHWLSNSIQQHHQFSQQVHHQSLPSQMWNSGISETQTPINSNNEPFVNQTNKTQNNMWEYGNMTVINPQNDMGNSKIKIEKITEEEVQQQLQQLESSIIQLNQRQQQQLQHASTQLKSDNLNNFFNSAAATSDYCKNKLELNHPKADEHQRKSEFNFSQENLGNESIHKNISPDLQTFLQNQNIMQGGQEKQFQNNKHQQKLKQHIDNSIPMEEPQNKQDFTLVSNKKEIIDKNMRKEFEEKCNNQKNLQLTKDEDNIKKSFSKVSTKKEQKKQTVNFEEERKAIDETKKRQRDEKKQRHIIEEEKKRQQIIEESKKKETLEEEKRQKDIEIRRQRVLLEAYQQAATESKQTKTQKITGSSIAPWSNSILSGKSNPGPSLVEIQKAEKERKAEEQRLEQILESQRKLQQQAEVVSSKETQVKWNATPVAVKSFAEIQAEEARKVLNEHTLSDNIRRKDVETSALSQNNNNICGTWISKSLPNNVWNTPNVTNIVPPTIKSNMSSLTKAVNMSNKSWSSSVITSNANVKTSANQSGFWEENIKPNSGITNTTVVSTNLNTGYQVKNGNLQLRPGLSKSQTVSSMQTVRKDGNSSSISLSKIVPNISSSNASGTKILNTTAKTAQLADNKQKKKESLISSCTSNTNKKDDARGEFTSWCVKVLTNFASDLDVPTFISFLQDIESPFEVKDYIRLYLGETKDCIDFAKQFLERRSKYKNQQRAQNAHIDDMCVPAPAINPGSNDSQEVKGKGKKIKKHKMTKLDARILGFSVTAAQDRINVGDRDYVDTS